MNFWTRWWKNRNLTACLLFIYFGVVWITFDEVVSCKAAKLDFPKIPSGPVMGRLWPPCLMFDTPTLGLVVWPRVNSDVDFKTKLRKSYNRTGWLKFSSVMFGKCFFPNSSLFNYLFIIIENDSRYGCVTQRIESVISDLLWSFSA